MMSTTPTPVELVQRYRQQHKLVAMARAVGLPLRYFTDFLAGRHRLNSRAAEGVAKELRRVGLIEDSDLSELRFQLDCRNMSIGSAA